MRARDARRERVRVIRFGIGPNDAEPDKKPIKTITYQLIWANVKKPVDRDTVPARIRASKRQTLFHNRYGNREQPASLDTKLNIFGIGVMVTRKDNVEYHKGFRAFGCGEGHDTCPYRPNTDNPIDSRYNRWHLGWFDAERQTQKEGKES